MMVVLTNYEAREAPFLGSLSWTASAEYGDKRTLGGSRACGFNFFSKSQK